MEEETRYNFRTNLPATRASNVKVNKLGNVIHFKFCHTCLIFRPQITSHCRLCNSCVEMFDHHYDSYDDVFYEHEDDVELDEGE